MAKNNQIGQRLRVFAHKFGGPTGLANTLKVSPQQLSEYFSGRRIPGNAMQKRLREAGCDIEWLMTGKKNYPGDANSPKKVGELQSNYEAAAGSSDKETREIFRLIERLNNLEEADRKKMLRLIHVIFEFV